MLSSEIRCPGCDRLFRPRGLAQHISKSRDARCRGGGAPLASQVPAVSIPQMVSPQPGDPSLLSEESEGGYPDDDLERQSAIGEFTATCALRRILKKL